MDESLYFVSRCPKCGKVRPQDTYTYAELRTQLVRGDAVVAYCAACDEVWTIDLRARAEIARKLAA